MPASDIRFVLRIPRKIYKELQAVKRSGCGLPSINTQIIRRLGNPDELDEKSIQDYQASIALNQPPQFRKL